MGKRIYYNTTNESQEQLNILTEIARTQNEKVLEIAKQLKIFSASKIFSNMPLNCPISSVRRALNTLEFKDFKVKKTGGKTLGLYGKNENEYTLTEASMQ